MNRLKFSVVTLVVVVNLSAALLAANLFYEQPMWIRFDVPWETEVQYIPVRAKGWPWPWRIGDEEERLSDSSFIPVFVKKDDVPRVLGLPLNQVDVVGPGGITNVPGLVGNCLVGLGLAAIMGFITEWAVRKRSVSTKEGATSAPSNDGQ